MGGKKPRGSDPARGSSFSCRSRRGGDFRSLSQELVGGGERILTQVQEFSLFSCMGVTEIAPWLSDESNQTDSHHPMVADNKHNDTSILNESNCIDSSYGQFDEKIKDLEEITRRLEQKVKNLETKQKEKEHSASRSRTESLFNGCFPDTKENRDTSQANDLKDVKPGGLNIERFRTLEGRQAFQQSKFSSLDIVFGGSSSAVWSKGCKKLRALLLSADDALDPRVSLLKESASASTGSDDKEDPCIKILLSETVENSPPLFEKKKQDDEVSNPTRLAANSSDDSKRIVAAESTGGSTVHPDAISSNQHGGEINSIKVAQHSEGVSPAEKFVSPEKACVSAVDTFNTPEGCPEKNNNNSNAGTVKRKKNERNRLTFQDCLYNQIQILVDNLNSHRKKMQLHLDFFMKNSVFDSTLPAQLECLNNEEDLCRYWTEIAVLNGRLDALMVDCNGKEDPLKVGSIESSIAHKVMRGISVKTDHTLQNDKSNRTNDDNYQSDDLGDVTENKLNPRCGSPNMKTSKSNNLKDKDKELSVTRALCGERSPPKATVFDPHRSSKQKQLNMRSSSNIRTNMNNGPYSSHNYEYGYSGDNRAVFYNTQGYPFGYNNHFISGNNFYGYPPSYAQKANFDAQGRYDSGGKNPAGPNYPRNGGADDITDLGPDTPNTASPGSSNYGGKTHSTFDLKDSMPLRYDSPMSPYASYYVYVPLSANNLSQAADDETRPSIDRREEMSGGKGEVIASKEEISD